MEQRTIAIAGASGFIGSALAKRLTSAGHRVRPLVRRAPSSPSEIEWHPENDAIDAAGLEGVDVVVNLAGETLDQRWSEDVKRRLREGRVRATTLLARTMAGMSRKPAVFLSGSAIGIYGDRGDEVLDETSVTGSDFLATLCVEWEGAARPAAEAGIRVASLRTGIVLAAHGGALARMLTPFRLGVGGKLGSGRQWMSWITLADTVGAIEWLMSATVAGPVNLVAPAPVTNEDMTRALSHELHRPALFAVPKIALRLVVGEMADAAVLASQRVTPRRLLEGGYQFEHRTIEQALAAVLSR